MAYSPEEFISNSWNILHNSTHDKIDGHEYFLVKPTEENFDSIDPELKAKLPLSENPLFIAIRGTYSTGDVKIDLDTLNGFTFEAQETKNSETKSIDFTSFLLKSAGLRLRKGFKKETIKNGYSYSYYAANSDESYALKAKINYEETNALGIGYVHRGYYKAAQTIINDKKFRSILTNWEGPIYITGHSSGGSIATILNAILKNKFPAKDFNTIAFNPAPCAELEGMKPYASKIVSIVNEKDVIHSLSFYSYLKYVEKNSKSLKYFGLYRTLKSMRIYDDVESYQVKYNQGTVLQLKPIKEQADLMSTQINNTDLKDLDLSPIATFHETLNSLIKRRRYSKDHEYNLVTDILHEAITLYLSNHSLSELKSLLDMYTYTPVNEGENTQNNP